MQKQTLLEGLRALPGDERLLRSLGRLLEQEQSWAELQAVMLEQLASVPRGTPLEAHVAYLAGKASLELGDLRQALAFCSRSVQVRDDLWYSQHIHGRVLARLGRRAEALQAQGRCAELAPHFPWCWFEIGQLRQQQGEAGAARQAFERALALQQAVDPAQSGLFRRALEGVQQEQRLRARRAAAQALWPDRPPLGPDERLPGLDRLELALEEFRQLLDRLEAEPERR